MKIFLTSNLGGTYYKDGIETFVPLNNKNQLVNNLKSAITKTQRISYIVSAPDFFDINDFYGTLAFECLKKAGFEFHETIIIDHRFNGNIKETLLQSDVIFLAGGKTDIQMAYFESLNLKEILQSYHGVLLGMSAGAMNCSNVVITPAEERSEIGRNMRWNGLGLTPFVLEPHFVLNVSETLDIELRKDLLRLSKGTDFIALCDDSYLFIDGNTTTLFGESYHIHKGEIKNIVKDGNFKILSYNDC